MVLNACVQGSRVHRCDGLSYIEAMVALAILAIALVPAMQAISHGVSASAEANAVSQPWIAARSKLEEVLSRPYAELDAAATAAGGATNPTTYSETAGTPGRRLVYLARYDGDNADGDGDGLTGGDAGLLWVRVAVEDTPAALVTLTAE